MNLLDRFVEWALPSKQSRTMGISPALYSKRKGLKRLIQFIVVFSLALIFIFAMSGELALITQ